MSADLPTHLRSFGIEDYKTDARYWTEGGDRLGRRRGEELNELRERFVVRRTLATQVAVYDFTADKRVFGVFASMKANAIRASGDWIATHLPPTGRVLDLGCSIGYLTTWYAITGPGRSVTGCDFIGKIIDRARDIAERRKITNVRYETADILTALPAGPFDAVVSTQGIGDVIGDVLATLASLRKVLSPGGMLLAVEPLPTFANAVSFAGQVSDAGFHLSEAMPIAFSERGKREGYPAMVFTTERPNAPPDLQQVYDQLLAWCNEGTVPPAAE